MFQNNIKILGDLEAEIMEIAWQAGALSVRDVLARLSKRKKIAYTTIMTVMSRLYDKGILKRKMDKSGAFMYLPAQDKESFLARSSEKIIKSFLREYGDVAVAQFVDIIETADTKQSAEWKSKLRDLVK